MYFWGRDGWICKPSYLLQVVDFTVVMKTETIVLPQNVC
jgi:hypothetical protein